MAIKIQNTIRTLRLKVKIDGYAWLNGAAIEVNDVWNFANATSYKAARPFVGPGNESSLSVAEPSQTYSRCEAGIRAMKAAA